MSRVHTTRNPMSEARRQHVHGALEPSEPPLEKGRYLFLLLVGMALLLPIAAAALP